MKYAPCDDYRSDFDSLFFKFPRNLELFFLIIIYMIISRYKWLLVTLQVYGRVYHVLDFMAAGRPCTLHLHIHLQRCFSVT